MEERIVINPKVRHGQPVVTGTRTPISRILGSLAGGMTEDEVLREYEITRDDLQAIFRYATQMVEQEVVRPLAQPV